MATAFGTACLPEIQGALETPSAPRMKKAITGCWIIILVTYTIIGVTGYWWVPISKGTLVTLTEC